MGFAVSTSTPTSTSLFSATTVASTATCPSKRSSVWRQTTRQSRTGASPASKTRASTPLHHDGTLGGARPPKACGRTATPPSIMPIQDNLGQRDKPFIHDFAIRRHYELKFSGVAQDVFSAVRTEVDRDIGNLVPGAVQKFTAVCLLYTSPSPRDGLLSRMPSSA